MATLAGLVVPAQLLFLPFSVLIITPWPSLLRFVQQGDRICKDLFALAGGAPSNKNCAERNCVKGGKRSKKDGKLLQSRCGLRGRKSCFPASLLFSMKALSEGPLSCHSEGRIGLRCDYYGMPSLLVSYFFRAAATFFFPFHPIAVFPSGIIRSRLAESRSFTRSTHTQTHARTHTHLMFLLFIGTRERRIYFAYSRQNVPTSCCRI